MRIDRNVTVTEVRQGTDEKQPRPSVVLSTGEVLEADLVIGADGAGSLARNVVYDRVHVSKPSNFALYVGQSPVALMKADPELKPLVENEQVRPLLLRILTMRDLPS